MKKKLSTIHLESTFLRSAKSEIMEWPTTTKSPPVFFNASYISHLFGHAHGLDKFLKDFDIIYSKFFWFHIPVESKISHTEIK